MAIEPALVDGVILTTLTGRITDEQLLSYYSLPFFRAYEGLWREVIDGRQITDMAITTAGMRDFQAFVAANAERLKGGRVAMVAASDLVYGMFRMWELRREGLGYGVRVFRDFAEARAWVAPAAGPGLLAPKESR